MPTLLLSFKKLENGHILLHGFLAPSQPAAEADMKAHAEGCPDFGPAFRGGKTIEFDREVDRLPEFDGDDLEEWIDEKLVLELDEDGDDDE